MIVSINPTYFCNFRCNFCYLTEEQLSDNITLLNLNRLNEMLTEISIYEKIELVDLYGGEVSLLPLEYYETMKSIISMYSSDINLITNMSAINDITKDEDVYLTVSYDFDAREKSDLVWKNMSLINKPFSVLMLACPKVMNMDVDYMISMFNLHHHLVSVEIKPYSPNQSQQLNTTYSEFEDFIKKWILSDTKKNFHFVNDTQIRESIQGNRNSFSNDHVYITPNGKFGVLEFDSNDNEYFLEYETLQEYMDWCEIEKSRVNKNLFCSNCRYNGCCLSEHLREVRNLDNSCNGFKHLLDWYEDERLENTTRNIPSFEL